MFEISHRSLMRISSSEIIINNALSQYITKKHDIPIDKLGEYIYPILVKHIKTEKGDGLAFYMHNHNSPYYSGMIKTKLKVIIKSNQVLRMSINIGGDKIDENHAFKILKKITRLNQWTIPLHPENVEGDDNPELLFNVFPNDVTQFFLKKLRDKAFLSNDEYKEFSINFNSLFMEEANSSYHIDLSDTSNFIRRYPYIKKSSKTRRIDRVEERIINARNKLVTESIPSTSFEKAKFVPNFEKAKKESSYLYINKLSNIYLIELFSKGDLPIYVNDSVSHKYELLIDKEASLICLHRTYDGEVFNFNDVGNMVIPVSQNEYPTLFSMLQKTLLRADKPLTSFIVREFSNDDQLVFKL